VSTPRGSEFISAPRGTEVVAPLGGNGVGSGGEAVSVDKIRDLLFGNQMQDYDRRFANLEERFLQRFKDIESETARNLGAFESNAKKQVDSLAGWSRIRRWKSVFDRCLISSASSIVTWLIALLESHKRGAKRSSRRTRTCSRRSRVCLRN
jgi:hypothetical protein